MIDSHAHLNDPRLLPDLEGVLERMGPAGVSGALVVGYDLPSSQRALELASRYPDLLRASVGVHPHESKSLGRAALASLEELASHPEVVAYGEIGLDFHYDHSPRDVQREAFRRQLGLAARLGLPVIIHEREATEEALAILTEGDGLAPGGVWHCCDLGPDLAKEIAGWLFIGIAGWITFPKAENIRAMARAVPLERVLVETDAPYLTPVPYRGRRNEPAHVRLVAEQLARVRGVSLERVAAVTKENIFRAFPRWGTERHHTQA